jgi:TolB-like protein
MKTKSILTIFLVLAFAVIGYFLIRKSPRLSKSPEPAEKSIAVLPFTNKGSDAESTYFINGLAEEILNDLQKIEDFKVMSRTSVEPYRNTTKSISEVAKELAINYILEGSGQKLGNKMLLNVQLIDAKNDKHLWGESYEQEAKNASDILNLQSQIAQKIAAELKAALTP